MRFILLFLCALFIGCEQGYETRVIEQGEDVAKKEKEVKEEKAEPKMLAEIDEDIVYIWADDTKRVYFGNELPEEGGHPTPRQFFYTDGTVADVVAFEYADQVPPEFVVDWETMLDKTIKQPISRIIEALGWEWADVDPERTNLSQWGF